MAWDKIRFNGEDSDGCIFTVMTGLSSFQLATSGKDIMVEFCRKHIEQKGQYHSWAGAGLYSHYVFSGPVASGYAQKFAKFLKDEKLGKLLESEAVANNKYHRDRLGNVYVWIPDEKAVLAWWDKNTPKTAAPAIVKVVPEKVAPAPAPLVAPKAAGNAFHADDTQPVQAYLGAQPYKPAAPKLARKVGNAKRIVDGW